MLSSDRTSSIFDEMGDIEGMTSDNGLEVMTFKVVKSQKLSDAEIALKNAQSDNPVDFNKLYGIHHVSAGVHDDVDNIISWF